MKLSISLPAEDVDRLDEFARAAGLPTRSAAIQRAIRLLDTAKLEAEYASAWDEWESSGEQAAWEGTVGDGLAVASR
jgi:Arc/MetJ-type ribon-helix-helix transcriptional regulator